MIGIRCQGDVNLIPCSSMEEAAQLIGVTVQTLRNNLKADAGNGIVVIGESADHAHQVEGMAVNLLVEETPDGFLGLVQAYENTEAVNREAGRALLKHIDLNTQEIAEHASIVLEPDVIYVARRQRQWDVGAQQSRPMYD